MSDDHLFPGGRGNCPSCLGTGWRVRRYPVVIGALFSENYMECHCVADVRAAILGTPERMEPYDAPASPPSEEPVSETERRDR